MNESTDQLRPALRVIHLAGGLRAFDLGESDVRVGPDFNRYFMTFPTQPYQETYQVLHSFGLESIGVDIISSSVPDVLEPPNFQTFTLEVGFAAKWSERAWGDVRHVPEQKTREIVDISGRFATYHRLLTLRIRELSEAYRRCLYACLTDLDGRYAPPKPNTFYSNGFQTYIEAAIHAFLADATGLRDLVAEATWRLVLGEPTKDVTTFSTLLKRTRQRKDGHPFLAHLHEAGSPEGWLKVLGQLRDSVTHIAPLANTHELHETQVRLQPLRGGSAPVLHYPLTTKDGAVRPRPDPIDFDDEATLHERFKVYAAFVAESEDALRYASRTARQLITLADQVRQQAGLKHKMLEITDADIVGPSRFHSGTP